MSDLIWVISKSLGQIFMFDYFHRENSFSIISKINMATFAVLLVYKAIKYNIMHQDTFSRIFSMTNIPSLLILIALTFINQQFYVYNLVTYSFIICDLGDQLYSMGSYYMRLSQGKEKEKKYRNGILTIMQIILVLSIFCMDVDFDSILTAAFCVLIEIGTKSMRFKILKKHQLDQTVLDFGSILLALGAHIGIQCFNIVFSDNQEIQTNSNDEASEQQSFFQNKNFFQLIGFIIILVLFSITNNEGLKTKKTKNNNRNQFQSLILWGLLLMNKYLDPQEMQWSSWTFIISYGVLAVLEMYNLKDDDSDTLLISTNTQHLHKGESYSEINMQNFILHIKKNKDSKKLLILLAMNFSFMFVELIYGILSNSLSLIGDSAHMLFDSSALAIGLYASFMSKLKPTLLFSYGYERFQVLSGFVNGLFLLFVSFDILVESIERIHSPQVVYSEKMMVVSILGLLINFIGLCFFSEHAHSGCVDHDHGDSHSHSHDHSETHSHSHSNDNDKLIQKQSCSHNHDHDHNHDHKHDHEHKHEHSHNHDHEHEHKHHHHHDHDHEHHHHDHGHNENLSGVFLHILADTLGSVGVIISSFLIQWYEWYISDPIMSFIISVLIFVSVFPLVKSSMHILLQSYPDSQGKVLNRFLDKLNSLDEVVSYDKLRFYSYTSQASVLSVKVKIQQDIHQQYALEKIISIIKKQGSIKYYNIEIVKPKQESNQLEIQQQNKKQNSSNNLLTNNSDNDDAI